MSENKLREKVTKSFFWSTSEKVFTFFGQFIVGIVLARKLFPEDYGLIGMISILIAISQTFTESGMGSGLIQKNKSSDIDFSTVFVFNFLVSVLCYLVLYFSAPFVAEFYEKPELIPIIRILSISIVINSLYIIHRTRLIIILDFKTIAKVNIISVLFSGLIAIYFAYKGYGVWALVIQVLIRSLISFIIFWVYSKWKPSLVFSIKSFKELFGFGSKILISGIIAQIFNNLYNIIIGKSYSATELGFYDRARSFSEIISGIVSNVIHDVTYPVLASLKDDSQHLVSVYSRILKMTSFIIIPSMTILAVLADPFIRILLTEKWLPVVPLLQWLCFSRVFYPITGINMNIINAVGRSDLYLKVNLIKWGLATVTLLITMQFGVRIMVIGQFITGIIAFFINAYLPGKLVGYGALSQLRDIRGVLFSTALMAVIIFAVTHFIETPILKLI
ncbi:lipopolysaccharide biosynthesis protein, partial [Flavobacteriaceae bacterium]|nr:lipopolysaccharide biosynthesis protein [Flavobacteriaceae bacterium]